MHRSDLPSYVSPLRQYSELVTESFEGEPVRSVDLESLDLGPMARHARTATFASNWLSVLAADAAVGLLIVVIGVVAAIWLGWPGLIVMAAGLTYLLLVGRRAMQWRWLRRRAGL